MKYAQRLLALTLLLGLLATPAAAQQQNSASPNVQQFKTLDLPSPNQYRSASGKPGPSYWQQRADYSIKASLDPARHRITGSEVITYTNNAPEPLDQIWLQLDQNLFRPGSQGSSVQPADSRWRGSFPGGGYDIASVAVIQNGKRTSVPFQIHDTAMRIPLAQPLAAKGGKMQIAVDYGFTIPNYGADRMGYLDVQQGTVFEIAQWYPRMYVFDDVNGWNTLPYLGQGEFYLEYGDFDVELTVPHDFIVVATGQLQNPDEVLTAEQRQRLDRARTSAETVTLIAQEDVGKPGTRPAGNGPLTWKYHAENVHDFTWAASQAFIWDAASYKNTLVMSVYPQEGLGTTDKPGWEMSTQYARHTIQDYSETWFPYPWPVAINVGGIVGGMEYPMIVFCSVKARGTGLFSVTDHELGHSWFPMIVGSDERRYGWMDEGFNTFINHYSKIDYYGPTTELVRGEASEQVAAKMASGVPQPSLTKPDEMRRADWGFLNYTKPAKGLIMLREYVLGHQRFDPAFQAYIQRWAYKHPQPADFFRTIENVSGEDLDWFWKEWFYSSETLDQAVTGVDVEDGRTVVTLANNADMVMPV
ncbi:MAG TPA: M1 family metallopeptidase, partial [Rhodothermales bacterium]|nr:M1 family metallopeptidase [Rhodothermales bacterium]